MFRLFFAFLILLAAVYLGIQLHNDQGYVLIAINHLRIETSLAVAVFALFLAFICLNVLFRLGRRLAKTPYAIHQYLINRSEALTKQGLIEYSEGYWSKAQTHLIKAIPHTETPLINYLTAAHCAQKMGDKTAADKYLQEALKLPDAQFAVELTKAQLQLGNHQWAQARTSLKELQALAPRHPYVLKLLMHLYEEVDDWPQMMALLPSLKKHQILNKETFDALTVKTYLNILRIQARDQGESLPAFFNSLPKSLSQHPALLGEYVHFLIQKNDFKTAETLLRRGLHKELNDQLIELYGLIPSTSEHLHFAESLLKHYPNSSALYLCLGRICLFLHLWGKSKYYLEEALKLKPSPIIYYELARLHDKLNDPTLAFTHYKKGLTLANQ